MSQLASCHNRDVDDEEELPKLSEPPLRVGGFNIQIFGKSKAANEEVFKIIVQILLRYHVVLIQEIRDSSGKAFTELVNELNGNTPDDPFQWVISERLGRTASKEQYAFLYRPSRVQLTGVYQFDDGVDDGTDMFEREPLAVRFTSPDTELTDFAIIGVHISPSDATREIEHLDEVYEAVQKHWNIPNILIAGDFNADCNFIKGNAWSTITLRNDEKYTWLIKDTEDTTVGRAKRTYDRFVTGTKGIENATVPGSVSVYRFDEELKIPGKVALKVSDHYPIELLLKGRVYDTLQRDLQSGMSFNIICSNHITDPNDVRKLYRAKPSVRNHFKTAVHKRGTKQLRVVAKKKAIHDVMGELMPLYRRFPKVISGNMLSAVQAYMKSGSFKAIPYVEGILPRPAVSYDVKVIARLQEPLTCEVIVTKRLS